MNLELSVFLFTGFIKSFPVSLEEAAMIDGCSIMQIYFKIVFPVIRPIIMTVAILNAMWIWNDYLLPYLEIGLSSNYVTIPVVVQYLVGSYGAKDLGAMMALLLLTKKQKKVFIKKCYDHHICNLIGYYQLE